MADGGWILMADGEWRMAEKSALQLQVPTPALFGFESASLRLGRSIRPRRGSVDTDT
jgi:hypothetical protein